MTYDRTQGWLADFRGVIAAVVTPFDSMGRPDVEAIRRVVELEVAAGIDAIMVGGTTGEFVAMSENDRRRTLEAFAEAVDGRVRVISHTGHADLRTARRLTLHAATIGVDGIAVVTPYYFPTTVAAAQSYFRELAETVPDTAFIAYDIPRNTTNPFPATAFEELADLPNLAGAKCSVPAYDDLLSYLRFEPAFRIICGNDTLLPEFVRAGGTAVVSGNAAAYPELIRRLFDRLLDGAWSPSDAALLADIALATRGGSPDRLKHLLGARGYDVGVALIRTYDASEAVADGNDAARVRVEHAFEASGPLRHERLRSTERGATNVDLEHRSHAG